MRIVTGQRVMVIAPTSSRQNDVPKAEAQQLLAQYEQEDRVWEYAKQSFMPLAMLALTLLA